MYALFCVFNSFNSYGESLSPIQPLSPINQRAHEYASNCFSGYSTRQPLDNSICPLINRVKISATNWSYAKEFWEFIGNNDPEISTDCAAIATLAAQTKLGNFTKEMITNSELPYLSLAAFAYQLISVWDVANLLIWHYLAKENPDLDLSIRPVFDQNGNWTADALSTIEANEKYLKRFAPAVSIDLQRLLERMQKLPLSQQVLRAFNQSWNVPVEYAKLTEFSWQAMQSLLLEAKDRYFATQPKLGLFSKRDLLGGWMDGYRQAYVPYPDVENSTIVQGKLVDQSQFAFHDRFHWILQNTHNSLLLKALKEIVPTFMQLTKKSMSKEIWNVVDGVFRSNANGASPAAQFNIALDRSTENSVWRWHVVLYLRQHAVEWKQKYGFVAADVETLQPMDALAAEAEPFLSNSSTIAQIYHLNTWASVHLYWHPDWLSPNPEFFRVRQFSQLSDYFDYVRKRDEPYLGLLGDDGDEVTLNTTIYRRRFGL